MEFEIHTTFVFGKQLIVSMVLNLTRKEYFHAKLNVKVVMIMIHFEINYLNYI